MVRINRVTTVAAIAATVSLVASACTGSNEGSATDDPTEDVTITFWHGWSADSEVQAIQDNVDLIRALNLYAAAEGFFPEQDWPDEAAND